MRATHPIILDCDPGHDDALAMILAAFDPRIELLAITTVAGNGPIEKVTENALPICTLVANSAIVESRMVNVEIELVGELTRGATLVDLHEVTGRAPNIEIALDLNVGLFWRDMLAAIAKSGAPDSRAGIKGLAVADFDYGK